MGCGAAAPPANLPALALALAAVASGTAWAWIAAMRAGERPLRFSLHALLGGAAAAGAGLAVYELATRLGVDVDWDRLYQHDRAALLLAGGVGLVEEGAKLLGVLLVVGRGVRTPAAVAASFGVAAGFSAIESFVNLAGIASVPAFSRALFGPVAHALLLTPAALAVAPALRSPSPARALALPLGISAALHALGDLFLAAPPFGPLGYAATLAAPALVLYARARSLDAEAEPARETAGDAATE